MTIGELLKNCRLEQAKTQKEWAGSVLTSSYYSKVEKGVHRITADDLLALLKENNVAILDFFEKLNLGEESKKDEQEEITSLVLEAYYQSDESTLKEMEKYLEKNNVSDGQVDSSLVRALMAIMKNDISELNQKDIENQKNKIFNIPEFTKDKIKIYCNFMVFFDFDDDLILTRRIIKKFKGNQNLKIQEILLSIIFNMIGMCIENNKDGLSTPFIKETNQIVTKPELFCHKNGIYLLCNLIEYRKSKNGKYLDNCYLALNDYDRLGMHGYYEEMKRFITDNKL